MAKPTSSAREASGSASPLTAGGYPAGAFRKYKPFFLILIMKFVLIGSGVGFDLTVSGVEELKSCDEAYIETYTNPLDRKEINLLENKIGKKIAVLERGQVEGRFLLDRAASADVCLIASGDPLTATTHITLVMEARERKIPVKVIHNSSVYSAAPAKSGLQIYRFGKTATLVNPRPNYQPKSSLDAIRSNLENNTHSLVLLDTEPKPMEAKNALEMLSEFETAVVLSRLGSDDEKISYGKIKDLKELELGRPPFTIVIPAGLHPVEQEFLDTL
ncbi:diphthine synthase [Candidatus Micrarchaeota archaeon]|nr:diphthine synthase [Candidatus Micrarchaeota archaeon]